MIKIRIFLRITHPSNEALLNFTYKSVNILRDTLLYIYVVHTKLLFLNKNLEFILYFPNFITTTF